MSENNFPHADYGLALGLRIRADCNFRTDCRITDYSRSCHLGSAPALFAAAAVVVFAVAQTNGGALATNDKK